MTLRIWMIITAVLFVIVGLLFALYSPGTALLFGLPTPPDPVPSAPDTWGIWVGIGFTRMFGAMMFALGVLLWFVRDILTPGTRRFTAAALAIGLGGAAGIAFVQQASIWNTTAGWILVAILFLLAVGYFYWALFPGVVVPPPDDIVELERDIHRHPAEQAQKPYED